MPVEQVDPLEVWDRMAADPEAVLIDVRMPDEWADVGIPDLSALDRQPVMLTWQPPPPPGRGPCFSDRLQDLGIGQDVTLYFLCRAGIRSLYAAMEAEAAGFRCCINIATGFEGDPDVTGARGVVNGWQADGLPWQRPDRTLLASE